MSSKVAKISIFLIIVAAVCYIFMLNPEHVKVTYQPSKTWDAPMALVLIVFFCLGGLAATTVALIFGVRQAYADWRFRRRYEMERGHQKQFITVREQIAAGSYEPAKSALKRMIAEDPENTVARVMLADAFERAGDAREALRTLDEARGATQKKNLELLFLAADLNAKLGNRTAALDNLSLILKAQPNNVQALSRAAAAAAELKRFAEAISFQERLIKASPAGRSGTDAQEHLASLELAQVLEDTATDAGAKRTRLDALLRRHREFPGALDELAKLDRETSALESASKLWTRAFRASSDIHFLESIAAMWLKVEQPSQAISAVRSALVPQTRGGEVSVEGELFLVNLLFQLEMHEDAEKELRRIEERGDAAKLPNDVKYLQAKFLRRRGDLRESLNILEKLAQSTLSKTLLNSLGGATPTADWAQRSKLEIRARQQPSPRLSTP